MDCAQINSTDLRFATLAITIKYSLSYWEYKLLAEYLGCYTYILPRARSLVILPATKITCAQDVFKQWALSDIIQSSMSRQDQISFASHINYKHLAKLL